MFAPLDSADVHPQPRLRDRTPAPAVDNGGRPRVAASNRAVAKAIAQALKLVRWEANLTQQQLAARLGTSRGRVSQVEAGTREPTWSSVIAWAHACDCSSIDIARAVEDALTGATVAA